MNFTNNQPRTPRFINIQNPIRLEFGRQSAERQSAPIAGRLGRLRFRLTAIIIFGFYTDIRVTYSHFVDSHFIDSTFANSRFVNTHQNQYPDNALFCLPNSYYRIMNETLLKTAVTPVIPLGTHRIYNIYTINYKLHKIWYL